VQTGNVDWGFHISSLFGTSYRFTANKGYFSQQLLEQNRQYGFDPVLEYFDLYIPQVADGLNISRQGLQMGRSPLRQPRLNSWCIIQVIYKRSSLGSGKVVDRALEHQG
jgi:hypothetical protein